MFRNIKRNHAFMIITIILGLIMLTPSYGTVKATWNGVHDVNAPTAKNTTQSDYAYGAGLGKKLDGLPIYLNTAGRLTTSDFTDPNYAQFLPFYGNRSDFPPDPALILHVHMAWYAQGNSYTMYVVYLEQFIGGTYTSIFCSPWIYGTGSWNYWEWHINETIAWTASNLTDPTEFRVGLLVLAGGLLVDYLGFRYLWTAGPPVPPGGGEIGGAFTMPDVIGLVGITGFIGMIGVPAASIWLFRRDGGSKIYAAVMALVAFTVCAGLFLGSINGG